VRGMQFILGKNGICMSHRVLRLFRQRNYNSVSNWKSILEQSIANNDRPCDVTMEMLRVGMRLQGYTAGSSCCCRLSILATFWDNVDCRVCPMRIAFCFRY